MGAVALHLTRDGQAVPPVTGLEFSVLPVGRRTGLPVHMHALFELPLDSKLYHTVPTTDVQQRTQARWNTAQYANVVSAYVSALMATCAECTANPLRIYKWWPQGDTKEVPVRAVHVRDLLAVPLMTCDHDPPPQHSCLEYA